MVPFLSADKKIQKFTYEFSLPTSTDGCFTVKVHIVSRVPTFLLDWSWMVTGITDAACCIKFSFILLCLNESLHHIHIIRSLLIDIIRL